MHYLFLARINADLERFILAWNNHKLSSTEHSRTPNQLLFLHQGDSNSVRYPAGAPERLENEAEDGAHDPDFQGPALEEAPLVEVIETNCPLSPENLAVFTLNIAPLTMNDQEDVFWPKILTAFQCMEPLLTIV